MGTSVKTRHSYEFGPFIADSEVRTLMREGEVVPLPPKVFHGRKAYFVAGGYVLFWSDEKERRFVFRVKEDGGELEKLMPFDTGASLFKPGFDR